MGKCELDVQFLQLWATDLSTHGQLLCSRRMTGPGMLSLTGNIVISTFFFFYFFPSHLVTAWVASLLGGTSGDILQVPKQRPPWLLIRAINSELNRQAQ